MDLLMMFTFSLLATAAWSLKDSQNLACNGTNPTDNNIQQWTHGSDALAAILRNNAQDIGLLKTKVRDVQGQLNQEKAKVSSLQNQLDTVKAEVRSLKSQIAETPKVAFSVTRTSVLPASPYRTTVKWQHVLTDLGGAWDQTVGQFRAPVAGLYAFHLTAASAINNNWMNLYLMKNGRFVTTAHSTIRAYSEGSTHAILKLNKSDTVLVQIGAGKSLYADTNMRTIFTGYLVSA